jgi:hypothetical protein
MDAFSECIHGKLPKVSMLMTKVLDDTIEKPSQFQDWYLAAFMREMEKELKTSDALKMDGSPKRDGSPKVSSSAKRTKRLVSENKNDKGSIPRRVAVAATVSPGHAAITQDPESDNLKPRKIPFEEEESTSSSSSSRAKSSSAGDGDSDDEDQQPDPAIHGLHIWQEENKLQKQYALSRLSCLFELTMEDETLVADQLSSDCHSEKNVSPGDFLFHCMQKNFLNLQPQHQLDDETIMATVRVLLLGKRDCFCFGTHFFQKACLQKGSKFSSATPIVLDSFDFDRVRDQGCKCPGGNIFNLEHVFFPINIENYHWTMAYMNKKRKVLFYYDSCWKPKNPLGSKYLEKLIVYLREEHRSIYGQDLPEGPDDWICQHPGFTMGPRQYDQYNCGVFIVFVIEALTNLRVDPEILFHFDDWKFDEEDMDKYRLRMGACILKKKT